MVGKEELERAGTGDLAERLMEPDHMLLLLLLLQTTRLVKEDCGLAGWGCKNVDGCTSNSNNTTPCLLCRGTRSLVKGRFWNCTLGTVEL